MIPFKILPIFLWLLVVLVPPATARVIQFEINIEMDLSEKSVANSRLFIKKEDKVVYSSSLSRQLLVNTEIGDQPIVDLYFNVSDLPDGYVSLPLQVSIGIDRTQPIALSIVVRKPDTGREAVDEAAKLLPREMNSLSKAAMLMACQNVGIVAKATLDSLARTGRQVHPNDVKIAFLFLTCSNQLVSDFVLSPGQFHDRVTDWLAVTSQQQDATVRKAILPNTTDLKKVLEHSRDMRTTILQRVYDKLIMKFANESDKLCKHMRELLSKVDQASDTRSTVALTTLHRNVYDADNLCVIRAAAINDLNVKELSKLNHNLEKTAKTQPPDQIAVRRELDLVKSFRIKSLKLPF